MEALKNYRVTDIAGPRPDIAGKRRRIGDVLQLNTSEVEFEISRGTVELITAKEAKEAREQAPGEKG